jgi:hypothetical protein
VTVTGVLATRTARRDLRVDAVRGVALVSMYVAHCAPTAGPGHVLTLCEYATYPLFALLVGVGAELGPRSGRASWVGPLVRGTVLIAAAQVVEGWGALIFVVLAHLGVLTWLAAPLARAPSPVVAGIGLGSLLVAPHLYQLANGWSDATFPGGESALRVARFLVADWPYQIVAMVFFAAIGILLTRYVLRPTRVTHAQRLLAGVACGLAAVVWIGLHEAGAFAMEAYDVTYRVLTFDALLVVAITLVAAGAAGLLPRAALPIAAMGGMSLTLYCLQVWWLGYDVRTLHPGATDDSWLNVVVLVLGSAALALAWRAVVRVEPWRRGPLEGPVAAAVRLLSRERVRA